MVVDGNEMETMRDADKEEEVETDIKTDIKK